MNIVRSVAEARSACGLLAREVGFVPTMGALHDGHLSLVRVARRRCASVAASVFVNPTQFGRDEDFDAYPRDERRDIDLLEREGVDVLFVPRSGEMYPAGHETIVHVDGPLTATFEGASRPGHFDGVATVVTKLLTIVSPDVLFLGQKDAQQLAVLRRMARDLDLPVEVAAVHTLREHDGLAMSSRNVRLTADERAIAPQLYAALQAARASLEGGANCETAVTTAMRVLDDAGAPGFAPDYIAVVDPVTFAPAPGSSRPRRGLIIAAARLGAVRLIDNLPFDRDP